MISSNGRVAIKTRSGTIRRHFVHKPSPAPIREVVLPDCYRPSAILRLGKTSLAVHLSDSLPFL